MVRAATVVCLVLVRAAVAATLAYAVWPAPTFIAIAALVDAAVGALDGFRAARGLRPARASLLIEIAARIVLLVAAKERLIHDGTYVPPVEQGEVASVFCTFLMWFAPIGIGRAVTAGLRAPFRKPGLHATERDRRALLSVGVSLLLVSACVMWIFRRVSIAGWIAFATGVASICWVVVLTRRRRRWVEDVGSGAVPSLQLQPIAEGADDALSLDESPDAVVVSNRSATFRSAREAIARVRSRGPVLGSADARVLRWLAIVPVATLLFDTACWHGSGWIPMRHLNGDRVGSPRLLSDVGLVEWQLERHGISLVYWDFRKASLETQTEWFARVSAIESPTHLAINVPKGTCAPPGFVRRRGLYSHDGARTLGERARIIEPTRRDGMLVYTHRARDEKLVRVEVTLDGRSANCVVDPPAVDDGGVSEPVTGATLIRAATSHTCARSKAGVVCWGDRISPLVPGLHALASVVDPGAFEFVVGDGFTCSDHGGGITCWGSRDVPVHGSGPPGRRLFAGGSHVAILPEFAPLEMIPSQSNLDTPADVGAFSDISRVAMAEDRACVLLTYGALRCWGPTAPRLEALAPVNEIAVGSSLACVIKQGFVWCASGADDAKMVAGLPPVSGLDVGGAHACALDVQGGVWCWGRNRYGELGDGTRLDRTEPVRVLTAASAVATGGEHTCAIGTDTTVRCWGRNDSGQLGDGTLVDRTTPVAVVW